MDHYLGHRLDEEFLCKVCEDYCRVIGDIQEPEVLLQVVAHSQLNIGVLTYDFIKGWGQTF
jgi:hypothetical protein